VWDNAGGGAPRTAANPEYFGDKSLSKPPHNDYYNAPSAPPATSGAGVSRTGSRFINESRV